KSKRCDAESAREGLQFRMRGRERMKMFRQTNIVCDHLQVAVPSGLTERHPDFQGAEAPGVLHPEIEVVRGLLPKMVVRRVIGKCAKQQLRFSYEGTTGFKRRVQPFVWIDSDRVRFLQCRQVCRGTRGVCCKRSIGAIDVKPQSVIPA